jgi:hypothetical protein
MCLLPSLKYFTQHHILLAHVRECSWTFEANNGFLQLGGMMHYLQPFCYNGLCMIIGVHTVEL